MRYDKRIVFVTEGASQYDETTGDYTKVPAERIIREAHVSDMGLEPMNLLYGKVVENAKTVRVQGSGPVDFDYIEIDSVLYSPALTRALRHETTYQVRKKQ